jgi:presenilin-like A22 family membrane protease
MNFDDNELKHLFNEQLPQAPKDKWFTRKVMNRLPPKEPATSSLIENISYIIAAIVVAVAYIFLILNITKSGTIKVSDIIVFISLTAASITILYSYLAPKVRQWINW